MVTPRPQTHSEAIAQLRVAQKSIGSSIYWLMQEEFAVLGELLRQAADSFDQALKLLSKGEAGYVAPFDLRYDPKTDNGNGTANKRVPKDVRHK